MAKSLERFLSKACVQTAVYWGTPVNDGYGGMTYDTPVEIYVRWDGSTQVITDSKGVEHTCKNEVVTLQDVDEQGFLYLGSLSDLSTAEKANPLLVDGAHCILQFDKNPMLFKTDDFMRVAYL
jgi:hypothetical protein